MIRGISALGQILVGVTRSSLEKLQTGEVLVSPAFEGRGPEILIIFAEDDRALRARLAKDGFTGPQTVEKDHRSS